MATGIRARLDSLSPVWIQAFDKERRGLLRSVPVGEMQKYEESLPGLRVGWEENIVKFRSEFY